MGDVTQQGRTVLFVSHNLASLRALCHNGLVLVNGAVDATGEINIMADRYSKALYERSTGGEHFPAHNPELGICLKSCSTRLQPNNGQLDLQIDVDIQTSRLVRNIGVGITLATMDGTKVSMIDPYITNHVIRELDGDCRCTLSCSAIDHYLAGGDYILEVWLERPLVLYFVRVKEAAIITIPPPDLFNTGKPFEIRRNGLIPLPMTITTAPQRTATVISPPVLGKTGLDGAEVSLR
jgi:lipopolysaccharide transport system ATP-binding protein